MQRRSRSPISPLRRVPRLECLETRDTPAVYEVANLNDGGPGSLRTAVLSAAISPEDDIVKFAADLTANGPATLTLTSGELLLAGASGFTSFEGPGADRLTIDGHAAGRILRIGPGTAAAVSGFTLQNGSDTTGGAIESSGTLLLTDSVVRNNQATVGGGVQNNGTLTMRRVTVENNHGGIGGGLYSNGELRIDDSTFFNNTATLLGGGGLAVDGGSEIRNSTISGNHSLRQGGGITAAGTLTLRNATIFQNTADQEGGGIYNSATTTLFNTLIAANVVNGEPNTPSDLVGQPVTATSAFNLLGVGGAGGLSDGDNGNRVGIVDPQLGPLQDNGGPTRTHAPLVGSPAVDHGSATYAVDTSLPESPPLPFDQRGPGFPRQNGASVDIGAIESPEPFAAADINQDGVTDPQDVAWIVYYFATYGPGDIARLPEGRPQRADVNGDRLLDAQDVLLVSFAFNPHAGSGAGEYRRGD